MQLALGGLTTGRGQDPIKNDLAQLVYVDLAINDFATVDVNVIALALKQIIVG
jgi:hypothetical protein